MISAINIWAVSLVRYTAGIVKQRKDELEAMDRWTRKLMTTYNTACIQEMMSIACTSRQRKEAEDCEHGRAESKQVHSA